MAKHLWLKARRLGNDRAGQELATYLRRGGVILMPYDQDGEEEVAELPIDKPLKVETTVYSTDPALRRLFHVIVGKIAKGMGKDKEDVTNEVKVYAGHCETFFIGDHTVKMPKSISEKKGCGELEFKAFFDNAMLAFTLEPFNIDPDVIEGWIEEAKRRRQRR